MDWRRKLRLAIVLLVTLWPVGHHILTQTHGVSPWKLAGWAMYTTASKPTPPMVFAQYPKMSVRVPLNALPESVLQEGQRFSYNIESVGLLGDGDDLASMLATAFPEWEGVTLVGARGGIDPDTGTVGELLFFYHYRFESGAAVPEGAEMGWRVESDLRNRVTNEMRSRGSRRSVATDR